MSQTFNEERTYGVEIEFFTDRTARRGFNQDEIARRITELSGVRVVSELYSHDTRNHWKIVTDSSVTGNALELVSPILKGRDGLNQLEKVLKALNEVGGKVDKTCGIHVHHGVDDYTADNMKNLFVTVLKFEDVLDSFVPESRRRDNNRYCHSISSVFYGNKEKTIARLMGATSFSDLESILYDRYLKLNYQAYLRHGTIEFRQHAGSTDFEKISNWVKLTQHMVDNAKVRKVSAEVSARWSTFKVFTDVLQISKAKGASEELVETLKFFKERAKALSQAVAA